MKVSKKLLAVASLAFASALSAGIAVTASAANEQSWDGFAITARAIRTETPAGLRFRTEAAQLTPDLMEQFASAKCYTTVSFTTAGGLSYQTDVPVGVWRNDAVPGWNTVLLDIPASDYATDITAKSYIVVSETTTYATSPVTVSIAQTASEVMNEAGEIDATLNAYVTDVKSLTVDKTAMTFVGEATQLTATIAPANYKVVWTTSDETVATVDKDGKVTGVKGGKVTITATMGDKSAACALTVYEKYEVATPEQFVAIPTEDPYVYVQLTQDVDFTGITINKTAGYKTVGIPEAALTTLTAASEGTTFKGVLDGAGYMLKNVTATTSSVWNVQNNTLGAANLFYNFGGMLKNLGVEMYANVAGTNQARYAGFAAIFSNGVSVSNCYLDVTVDHPAVSNYPTAPLAGILSVQSGTVVIENVVSSLTVNNARTDAAACASGLIGRLTYSSGVEMIVKNCFVAEVDPKDAGGQLEAYGEASHRDWQTPTTATNVNLYNNKEDMLVAAKASGLTAANGWNENWTVNNQLNMVKFGDESIYQGEIVVDLFLVNGANTNNVSNTAALNLGAGATYVSNNEAVATVAADGTVTGVAAGATTISATVNGETLSVDVNVYNYHELATAEDFKPLMAASSFSAYDYYMLSTDIDFTGITVNETEGYKTIGAAADATFVGVFDGNGHSITNLTATYSKSSGYASLFYLMGGTIKNLAVEMTLDVPGQYYTRNGGLNGQLRSGAYISNCYVEITTPYDTDNNWPVCPYGSISINGGTITLENCVGVMNDIANKDTTDGYATGLVGRYNGNVTLTLKNCYAVEINPSWNYGDVEAEYYADQKDTGDWQNVTNVTNVYAYDTLAKMFNAAKTGMTAANGWNSFWSVDAANNTLKFGDLVVYQAE